MYRFKSLLWFLINFKQTTRKSNNSAKIVQTIDRHFHEIHVPYVDTSLPASSYIFGTYPWLQNLYLLLGSMWHWATNSDLDHLEASLRRKNEDMCGRILLHVLYSVFWCSFFVRLCLLFKILVPLTGTEFPLITLSSQQYDWLYHCGECCHPVVLKPRASL